MAVKTTPVMSSTGPVGRWLPGIHLGVVRETGPGFDGDVDLGVVELARSVGEVGGDGMGVFCAMADEARKAKGKQSGGANEHERGFVFLEWR